MSFRKKKNIKIAWLPFTSIADTILSIIGLMLSIYLNSVYVEHLRYDGGN